MTDFTKKFSFSTVNEDVSIGYLPLSGGIMTGAISYDGINNGSAFVSTTKLFLIGAGNNVDLNSATVYSTVAFTNLGDSLAMSVGDGSTGEANIQIFPDRVFLEASNTSTGKFITLDLYSSSATLQSTDTHFIGLSYNTITAGYVTTNQTQYSLLHRAAGDARWSPIGVSGSFTTTDGKTITVTNGSITSIV